MTSEPQLAQLELLAQIDALTARVAEWSDRRVPWQPVQRAQALLKRVLSRVETLRIRLEAPLVAATFGGTGTGKSSLVNALVGEECTPTGRERPTTRRPVLIAHPKTALEGLGFPVDGFEIIHRESDLLRDMVLIDCPDPDTSDTDSPGSNLQRLHALLPFCDVLIYTSTQQKYRSARVADELGQAAAGCRLVFVQTHADLDEDIRADWRRHLHEQYEIPDVFLVDSLRGLREQQAGQRPAGDLARLQDLLTTQLAASERARIRRANVLDLLDGALARCQSSLVEQTESLQLLETALVEQHAALSQRLSQRLQHELVGTRNLWERRLLTSVSDTWGFSPFSAMLRLYAGLGALITSLSFFRARSAAQMALLGAIHGTRWWAGKREERSAEEKLASAFCLDDALLRESELVIQGHIRAAGVAATNGTAHSLSQLRQRAAGVEQEFLSDAGRRTDEIIDRLARRNSRWYVRAWYELLFGAYLGFVLYRVGRNFFYDSWLNKEALLSTDFYVPAGLFLVLWSALLIMAFTRRLRRGLKGEINSLASDLVHGQFGSGLFPDVETACRSARAATDDVELLQQATEGLRQEVAVSPALGGLRVMRGQQFETVHAS